MGKATTGIERLRDIAYDGPYSGGMVHISVQRLREICEQIEGEGGAGTVKSEAMEELKKRLAPGGCRPLLGADGSPIVPGGVYYGQSDGKRWRVDAVGTLFAWAGLSKTARMRGEGPKRLRPEWLSKEPPAPKVLDADGVEIEPGDTVWTDYGDGPWTVTRITTAHARHVYGESDELGSLDMPPSTLTHRAPVIAADGKPLRKGETVWHRESGLKLTVESLPKIGYQSVELVADDGAGFDYDPDLLTHKRPEIDGRGLSERDVADVIHALLSGRSGVDADWLDDIAARVCSALGIRVYGKRDGAR